MSDLDRTGLIHGWRRGASTAAAILMAATGASTGVAAQPAAKIDPVAEVTAVEHKLEKIFNSSAFQKDPAIALKYFDDTRMFDIMAPGEFRGEAFKSHFIEVGKQFQGKVEFTDLEVEADAKLGFASMLQHFSGKDKDGKPFTMVMRVTDSFHKIDGAWKIAAEHVSLTLDPATFMSLIKPKS